MLALFGPTDAWWGKGKANAEELAQLKGNYWELFTDMEKLKGTQEALVWLESRKARMPSNEYKRLASRGKETIKSKAKDEKNKVKWDKAREKREAIERAKGPPAPSWMQAKAREMSEQNTRDIVSWRNFYNTY